MRCESALVWLFSGPRSPPESAWLATEQKVHGLSSVNMKRATCEAGTGLVRGEAAETADWCRAHADAEVEDQTTLDYRFGADIDAVGV